MLRAMALLNFAHRELVARVVYFGPEGAGCNTNVEVLQQRLESRETTGELLAFGPTEDGEHARWFEYRVGAPDELPLAGVRVQVCSIPGKMADPMWRERLVAEADCVVFVADARPSKTRSNIDAYMELERMVEQSGRELADLPVVVQVNHTDHPHSQSAEKVIYDLNAGQFPSFESAALSGEGVIATQEAASELLLEAISDLLRGRPSNVHLQATYRQRRSTDLEMLTAIMDRLTGEQVPPDVIFAEYRALPAGPSVELAFQPEEFIGSRPVHVLGTRVEGDSIVVEIVMDRLSGEAPRRLSVHLMNRPENAPQLTRQTHAVKVDPQNSPSMALPEVIEKRRASDRGSQDLPPVAYGFAGIVGGAVLGLLIGFLLFA